MNFNKKMGILYVVIACFIAVYISFALSQEKENAINQGDLARILADRLNIRPAEFTTQECFKVLEQKGIKPEDGWSADKALTKDDLATILADAGRLQAEVMAGKDTISVLRERGVVLPPDVDRASVDRLLNDQNVDRLLEAPSLLKAGPSIPYPKKEIEAEGANPLTQSEEKLETTAPQVQILSQDMPAGAGADAGTEPKREEVVVPVQPPPAAPPADEKALAGESGDDEKNMNGEVTQPPATEPPTEEPPPATEPPTEEPPAPSGGGAL